MITEARMGRRFRPLLEAGRRPLARFASVKSEVEFTQGRPDFVCMSPVRGGRRSLPQLFAKARIPASNIARVLTILDREQYLSLPDLADAAAVPLTRARRILAPLARIKAVRADGLDAVEVVDLDLIHRPDLWAFELKLDDWKRCLTQTLVCRTYAHRVTAVFPASKVKHITAIAPEFERHHIGVMLFDVDSQKIQPVVPTPAVKPLSAYSAWMACFDVAAG